VQHKTVTVTLIFFHNMFRTYTAIKYPCYAKLFTARACLNFKIKIKIGRRIKFSKNGFDLRVGSISVILGDVGAFHIVR
jgi:hypothetical protein